MDGMEGMDAGLCGFSIQRLGPNSTQADFDGTPMVTDTMVEAPGAFVDRPDRLPYERLRPGVRLGPNGRVR